MRFQTLNDWLTWQETLHPTTIELGLDRVREVFDRMGLGEPPFTVITIGGTNGKGSVVAMLEAMLIAAGYRVGTYTSPHLLHYNERVRVQGETASDEALCNAFEQVDGARGDTSLTYFEFGTLAAFDLLYGANLDVAILEVGLGGRLDAVNILDADVAVITSIGIDHTAWLGETREAIAAEKVGIARAGRPLVCGDVEPPENLETLASGHGAACYRIGRDFGFEGAASGWSWWGLNRRLHTLPFPSLRGRFQLTNAATALCVLELLRERHPLSAGDVRTGLAAAVLPGRFQVIPGPVPTILDVAHNPHAARVLAATLDEMPCPGQTHAVVAMLADKDIAAVLNTLAGAVGAWYVAGLDEPRGASAETLQSCLAGLAAADVAAYPDVTAAYRDACERAGRDDRIVVFGSFYTVAAVLALSDQRPG